MTHDHNPPFAKWSFGALVKKKQDYRWKVCSKCGGVIKKGEPYRAGSSRSKPYCLRCVGFICSRYEGTAGIELSVREREWKAYFDAEKYDRAAGFRDGDNLALPTSGCMRE